MGIRRATGGNLRKAGGGGGVRGALVAYAPPGATFTHGQPFTFNGEGFGSKTTAAPWFYDDWSGRDEDDTPAGTYGIVGAVAYQDYLGGTQTFDYYGITEDAARRAGGKGLRRVSNSCFRGPFLEHDGTPLVCYLTFWARVQHTSLAGLGYGIMKWSRITCGTDGNEYSGNPGLRNSGYLGNTSGPAPPSAFVDYNDGVENKPTLWTAFGSSFTLNTWGRIEVAVVLSDPPGTANGRYYARAAGAGSSATNVVTRATGITRGVRAIFPEMHLANAEVGPNGNPADRYTCDWGEIYIDTTEQRVELGNAATWAAVTHREVQRATSWSDSSITIVCNVGTIGTGTRYLYVIGADGVPVTTNGLSVEVA